MSNVRMGWAYGLCIGSSEWLTILGSAFKAPELAGAPGDVLPPEAPAPEWGEWVLAEVEEVWHGGVTGARPYAYRILQSATGSAD
jgi:hypothetical protein